MVADFAKKQKRGEKKEYLLKIFAVIFLIVGVFLVFKNIKLYGRKKDFTGEVVNFQKQVQSLQNSNQKLKEEIANSGNSDYIEKVAREDEGMQKPGENVVSFIMPKETPIPEAPKTGWQSFVQGWHNFCQQFVDIFK